ncbi:MAG: CPBP family intramembrane metalloprotease [Phycisphaerales bacterium]|nr:CPBP family intramembrane metalloprotease [Phycisphaerales bacterium]
MAKAPRGRGTQPAHENSGDISIGYWDRSRQPLEILALVTPLVAAYEAGLVWILSTDRGTLTNRAHEGLLRLFEAFDIDARAFSMPALAMPALALLAVLTVQQLLTRKSWSIHLPTVGFMALESVLAALPLLVLGGVLARAMPLMAESWAVAFASLPSMAQQAAEQVHGLPLLGKISVAIGAGLYEELVFRMVLILFLHMVLVDVCKAPQLLGTAIAILVSAALFALYHPLDGTNGAISPRRAIFYLVAGIYFGILYVVRGFGIAVGAHAAYDIVVVGWFEG